MAGSITISSSAITSSQGTKVIGPLIISAAGNISQITDSLFPGAQSNNIPVPTGTTAIVIVPPTGNLVGLTLKGNNADVGIPLAPNFPTVLSVASFFFFILVSAGAITGPVEISFI